ncbi:MAG: RtcB family protein [Pseudomonadota bacterium]
MSETGSETAATVTAKDLLALGWEQGRELGDALRYLNGAGLSPDAAADWAKSNRPAPKLTLQTAPDYAFHLEAETEEEAENAANVRATMDALMTTPTIRAGAVMPDACPAGAEGTIPVGGVATAENAIHPGMHSADICCSVMVSEFRGVDPKTLLDAAQKVTHFGPGGRADGLRFTVPLPLLDAFRENAFLSDEKIVAAAQEHMGTQGDGNHFAFVGVSKANGTACLVTHHGSRGPGAGLYKLGMKAAEKWRRRLSPKTLKQNAWIPADSEEGAAYWAALQLIRKWTKANHEAIHEATLRVARADLLRRFWNEHNFVFREGDLLHHAKGATPIDAAFLPDADGTQIVPLNMAEPVLLIRGERTKANLGFAPHGAGRNRSRVAHRRSLGERTAEQIFAEETQGLDVRFYSGEIDVSELPTAYKPAATVRDQMARFRLADVVDEIEPYGCVMAGDWERNAPWRLKAEAKRAAREAGR